MIRKYDEGIVVEKELLAVNVNRGTLVAGSRAQCVLTGRERYQE